MRSVLLFALLISILISGWATLQAPSPTVIPTTTPSPSPAPTATPNPQSLLMEQLASAQGAGF